MKIGSGTRSTTARTLWSMPNKSFSFAQTITPSQWVQDSSTRKYTYTWNELSMSDSQNLLLKICSLGTISNGTLTSHTVTNVELGSNVVHTASFTTNSLGLWYIKIILNSTTKPSRNYEVSISGTYTDTVAENNSPNHTGEYNVCYMGNTAFVPRMPKSVVVGNIYEHHNFMVGGHSIFLSEVGWDEHEQWQGSGEYVRFEVNGSASEFSFGTAYSTRYGWQPTIVGEIYEMPQGFFDDQTELWIFYGEDAYDYVSNNDWFVSGQDWVNSGLPLLVKLYINNGKWYYDLY